LLLGNKIVDKVEYNGFESLISISTQNQLLMLQLEFKYQLASDIFSDEFYLISWWT